MAVNDPVLKFKHLVTIEDSYGVYIYDESEYGYWGILIPEARRDVDTYKNSRIRMGERITPESPILATLPSRWKTKRDHVSDENLQSLIYTMIQGKVSRIKKENRYDKALITMFRKRFNTKLKLNNKVNSNVAELIMAHKLPGIQDTYTAPTLEQIYDTIKHAIPELTIDPSARKQALLDQKEQENSELQMKVDDIERLKADMDRMQLILDSKT